LLDDWRPSHNSESVDFLGTPSSLKQYFIVSVIVLDGCDIVNGDFDLRSAAATVGELELDVYEVGDDDNGDCDDALVILDSILFSFLTRTQFLVS